LFQDLGYADSGAMDDGLAVEDFRVLSNLDKVP
jgi:hypothetical protein